MFSPASTAAAILLVAGIPGAVAADDVITKRSSHAFPTTLERVEASAKEKGFMIFARLDHAAAAASVGQAMLPSTVLVIGNPRVGTERFVRFPTLAIDLPLRVLVWQDQTGAAFVTYNAARHMLTIAQRHGLPATDVVVTQAERTEELMTTIADSAVR